jgi:type IV secretion system protein VirB9
MNRSSFLATGFALTFASSVAMAQDASARTVQYHSQDIVPIHAKLK